MPSRNPIYTVAEGPRRHALASRFWIAGLVVLGIALGATALNSRVEAARTNALAQSLRRSNDDAKSGARELESLRARLSQLEGQSKDHARGIPQAQASAATIPGDPAAQARSDAEAVDAYEVMVSEAAEAEPADGEWSRAVSSGFVAGIADSGLAVRLDAVRCASTLCTVTISHRDPDAHMHLFRSLVGETGKPVASGMGGPALIRRHSATDGSYRTAIYIAPVGGSLPQPDGEAE